MQGGEGGMDAARCPRVNTLDELMSATSHKRVIHVAISVVNEYILNFLSRVKKKFKFVESTEEAKQNNDRVARKQLDHVAHTFHRTRPTLANAFLLDMLHDRAASAAIAVLQGADVR